MTIKQATDILQIMRDTTTDQVWSMPEDQFNKIVKQIGESQFTFYKANRLDLERESIGLESVWYAREMSGV